MPKSFLVIVWPSSERCYKVKLYMMHSKQTFKQYQFIKVVCKVSLLSKNWVTGWTEGNSIQRCHKRQLLTTCSSSNPHVQRQSVKWLQTPFWSLINWTFSTFSRLSSNQSTIYTCTNVIKAQVSVLYPPPTSHTYYTYKSLVCPEVKSKNLPICKFNVVLVFVNEHS